MAMRASAWARSYVLLENHGDRATIASILLSLSRTTGPAHDPLRGCGCPRGERRGFLWCPLGHVRRYLRRVQQPDCEVAPVVAVLLEPPDHQCKEAANPRCDRENELGADRHVFASCLIVSRRRVTGQC